MLSCNPGEQVYRALLNSAVSGTDHRIHTTKKILVSKLQGVNLKRVDCRIALISNMYVWHNKEHVFTSCISSDHPSVSRVAVCSITLYLLSWGHCLGLLLETAYSTLPSQTCTCLLHNVKHIVWHNVMLEYRSF